MLDTFYVAKTKVRRSDIEIDLYSLKGTFKASLRNRPLLIEEGDNYNIRSICNTLGLNIGPTI